MAFSLALMGGGWSVGSGVGEPPDLRSVTRHCSCDLRCGPWCRSACSVAGGFRLEPTGRNPRHFTVAFDDLEAGIVGLRRCEHRNWANP